MKSVFFCKTKRIGRVGFVEENGAIVQVLMHGQKPAAGIQEMKTPLAERAECQLEEYLTGERQAFELPLNPAGSMFQRRVWQAIQQLPYGEAIRLPRLAELARSPRAFSAVSKAVFGNPVPLVIPCHRVLEADGSIGRYAGGQTVLKEKLLDLEGYVPPEEAPPEPEPELDPWEDFKIKWE